MKFTECRLIDEIFTHVDHDDNDRVRHFNATRIFEWAVAHKSEVEFHRLRLEKEFIDFVLKTRGIEEPKVARLREPYVSVPILFCAMPDGTHLTVDGHHRIVWRWRRGIRWVDGLIIKQEQWEPFLVDFEGNEELAWAGLDFKPTGG